MLLCQRVRVAGFHAELCTKVRLNNPETCCCMRMYRDSWWAGREQLISRQTRKYRTGKRKEPGDLRWLVVYTPESRWCQREKGYVSLAHDGSGDALNKSNPHKCFAHFCAFLPPVLCGNTPRLLRKLRLCRLLI